MLHVLVYTQLEQNLLPFEPQTFLLTCVSTTLDTYPICLFLKEMLLEASYFSRVALTATQHSQPSLL